jgi:hypothetical protein
MRGMKAVPTGVKAAIGSMCPTGRCKKSPEGQKGKHRATRSHD